MQQGTVLSIKLIQDRSGEPVFEVLISPSREPQDDTFGVVTVKTRRVVCAMGPIFRPLEAAQSWESSLRQELGVHQDAVFDRILHSDRVIPYVNTLEDGGDDVKMRVLVVGGGESVCFVDHSPEECSIPIFLNSLSCA